MIVHSWRHATPSYRIDHDTSPMVPLHLTGRSSRRFSPGSRQSSRKHIFWHITGPTDSILQRRAQDHELFTSPIFKSDGARVLAVLKSGR